MSLFPAWSRHVALCCVLCCVRCCCRMFSVLCALSALKPLKPFPLPRSCPPDCQSPDCQSPDCQSPDCQSPDCQSPDCQSRELSTFCSTLNNPPLPICLCLQVTYQPDLGSTQEYYLGSGGVWNLYSSLTGELLPGKIAAAAQVCMQAAAFSLPTRLLSSFSCHFFFTLSLCAETHMGTQAGSTLSHTHKSTHYCY
jgi:hypothetical protein